MRAIKYRELKQLYEAEGADKTCRRLGAALESKELKPEDFSIKEIAEATLGVDRVKALDPRSGSSILEAGDGVDVTAFSNITGQLIYFRIMESYQNPGFWASGLIPNIPTPLRRADPRYRENHRRDPRSQGRNALRKLRIRGRLPGHAGNDQTRVHRSGDEGGHLLRPYRFDPESCRRGRRDTGVEQGEAASGPAVGRDQQLQPQGQCLQPYQTTATNIAPVGDWINALTNTLTDLDGR